MVAAARTRRNARAGTAGRARGAPYVWRMLVVASLPVSGLISGQIAAAAACWVTADRRVPTEPPARLLALVAMAAAGLVLLTVIALVDGMDTTAANCSDLDDDALRENTTRVAWSAGRRGGPRVDPCGG
jgi:hypothetical protein